MNEIDCMAQQISEPVWMERAANFAGKVLDIMNFDDWSMSLMFCDDEFIRNLNRDYRGKDSATDVLSFTQIEDPADLPVNEPFFAGDIVISLDALAENSRYFDVPEEEELKRLIIHGILHLSGLDHSDNSPEQEMLVLQEQVLAQLSEEKIY